MRRTWLKNLSGCLIVAVLLALLLLPTRYDSTVFAYLAPVLAALLTVCSVLCTLYIRRNVGFASDSGRLECRRGEDVPLRVRVQNGSRLVCPRARAWLYVSDPLGGGDTVTPADFTLAARSGSDFEFDVGMNHIGQYRAGLKDVELYDFFGLFRFPVRGRKELAVTVLPRDRTARELELSDKMLTESHNQRKSVVSDGFDYTGVREYALGDSMKRIHWKLSAHSHDYMTKITETSLRNDLAVLLDMSAPEGDTETRACLCDAVVEYGLSFLKQASKMDAEYALLYPGRDGELRRAVPKGRGGAAELVADLAPFGAEGIDGARLLASERRHQNASSNLLLVTARPTAELLRELVAVKRQKRNPMLVFIIPHGTDRAAREALFRPLRALEGYGIAWYAIPADAR